jgi:hypothetical protein
MKWAALTCCAVAWLVSLGTHVTTFFTSVSFSWLIVPLVRMFIAILCMRRFQVRPATYNFELAWLGFALLLYSLTMFYIFYKTTGGASGVAISDGAYVATYKNQVIRTITEKEYREFPNRWVRVMSAWLTMMATFGLAYCVDRRPKRAS